MELDVDRTKEYMASKRAKVIDTVNKVMKAQKKILDTEDIIQEIIHIGDMTMTFLVFGHKGGKRKSEVSENFHKSFMLLNGSIMITFEDGEVQELTEENDMLKINNNKKYVSEALEDNTVVVVKLKNY